MRSILTIGLAVLLFASELCILITVASPSVNRVVAQRVKRQDPLETAVGVAVDLAYSAVDAFNNALSFRGLSKTKLGFGGASLEDERMIEGGYGPASSSDNCDSDEDCNTRRRKKRQQPQLPDFSQIFGTGGGNPVQQFMDFIQEKIRFVTRFMNDLSQGQIPSFT